MAVQTMQKERKLHYTEDQYRYARDECSALEYALSQSYDLVRKGNYYQMREHDSMVFTANGHWFWNSRSLNGGAIEFIMHYEGKTEVEAVLILNHAEGQTYEDVKNGRLAQHSSRQPAQVPRTVPAPVEKVSFKLPAQSNDFRRLFGYLCGTRKLDRDILHELIQQKSLYESVYRYVVKSTGEMKEVHNAVFVGRDRHGEPKSAFQRGLSTLGENTTYKRDVSGSDPSAPFCIHGHEGAETVIVFEASIDAISHACIYKDAGLDYKLYDRIALGGTEKTIGLTTYLQTHPTISRVVIAMDEDAGGRAAEHHIRELLDETQYEIVSLRQSMGKDWNEYLVKWRQIAEGAAQLPTTGTYSIRPGKSVGRVHYLDDRCEVVSTTDYDDRAAFQHEVRRCLSIGQRIVAETPEQQARIHRDRSPRTPAQAQPPLELEDEMEL
ncbi:MAG: DUF3991 and TOPRIM domain-containing protein [Oscillibacter sp.]|uniref:DUF3991 and TOPRIM domain-containing protein n=1 Tax=Oscillibacter sp. TaxID=1945593 RepID=UPI0025F6493E|nr:DUF3991 and TOPRIM domain-containing protein [Oscillibacter sp.]MEA4993908.1 DUF3991 and TOPRIM domain-containing protein [Oscillibacter sp.]